MSTFQKELEAAEAPATLSADEVRDKIAEVKRIAEDHDPEKYRENVEQAKNTVLASVLKQFQDTLVELIAKLKKGVPTFAKEFDYIMDAFNARALDSAGFAGKTVVRLVEVMESDEKGVSTVDGASNMLGRQALIKRVRRGDHEVVKRVMRAEKAVLRTTTGLDVDELWGVFPKRAREVVFMYVEKLYGLAKKYQSIAAFYDGGHWRGFIGKIADTLGEQVDAALDGASGPDGVDRRKLLDAVFSGLRGRANGAAGGPAGPEGLEAVMREFKAMGLDPGALGAAMKQ